MKKHLHTIHAHSIAVFIAVLMAILVCASNCAQAELVKPGQKNASANITPKKDFIAWAAQMAPSDTKVLLAIDGTQWPREEVNIVSISDLYKGIPIIEDAVNEICPEISALTVEDLAWINEQVAFYSCDTPGAKNTTADIVSVRINDREQAERFLADYYTKIMQRAEAHRLETLLADEADDEEAAPAASIDPETIEVLTAELNGRNMHYLKNSLAWYVSDDCAYVSTNENYLRRFLQKRDPQDSLSHNQSFVKAMKQLTFKKGLVAYIDLTASDEQLQFINDLVNSLNVQNTEADSKESDQYRFVKAMRNAIYGAEFRQGQLICEGFINADVANSGAWGQVCFNPKYNLDYPAWDKRTDQTLICLGGNLRYAYDGIYELMSICNETKMIRDLPASLCKSEGIDLRSDILEGLLSGQLVVSVEDIDFQALGQALQMPPAENDRQKQTEDAVAEACQDDPQTSDDSDEITVNQQKRRQASRVGKLVVNSIANGQWNISIGLRSQQALQELSKKNETIGKMLNDKDFIVVKGNDMWISSPKQPSGNHPSLSSLPCWQQLQKISQGPAVAQWMLNIRALGQGLESLFQGELASDPTVKFILGKLQECGWYCGRVSITPQGLHICEIIEHK